VCLLGIAQQTSASKLGLGTTVISADTLNFDDTLLITTYIVNYDTASYNGTINLAYKLNGIENIDPKLFPQPLNGQTLSIPAGDSLQLIIQVIISPAYFESGPNILVVWPICPDDSPPHSEFSKIIYVEDPAEIRGTPNSIDKLKIYASSGAVFVAVEPGELFLNRVRIFDMEGRCIYALKVNSLNEVLSLQCYSYATYIIEVTLSNGEVTSRKVYSR
jgi:hypothetical protein